jgi:hypothetical protein
MLMLDIGTDLGDIPEDILELGNDPLFGSGGDMTSAGRRWWWVGLQGKGECCSSGWWVGEWLWCGLTALAMDCVQQIVFVLHGTRGSLLTC